MTVLKPILVSLALSAVALATPAMACRTCTSSTIPFVCDNNCSSSTQAYVTISGDTPVPAPKTSLDKAGAICHEHADGATQGGYGGDWVWQYSDAWRDCKKIDDKIAARALAKARAAEEAQARRESPLKEFVTGVALGKIK